MSHDEILTTLRKLLVTDLFVEQAESAIGTEDGLQSALGLDSVGFLELRVLCERRFDVKIADDDFNPGNFSSIGRIADLVVKLRAAAS